MTPKRAFDLSVVVCSAPLVLTLLAALAMASYLRQGRPLFFRQWRLGRENRPFLIWKLRTMTLEPDPAERKPTPFGRWMRDRGVDELPQLFNVLLGDMSLVGPRPLTPEDVRRLEAAHPGFRDRLAARPGLTGPAQVTLTRGAAATLALDRDYAAHPTLLRDLQLILRTLWMHVVGKRRGAAPLKARAGRE